jgi:hypothetical protein
MEKGLAVFQLFFQKGEFEISDAHIKRLLDDVRATAQKTIDELGLNHIEPRSILQEGGADYTRIPKYDADHYLEALGLPDSKNIVGRPVKINLKDNHDNRYTVNGKLKDYSITRGFGIQLFFDKTENIPTPAPDCGVYNIVFLAHEAAKEDALAGGGGWRALMQSVGTEKDALWLVESITFLWGKI